MQHKGKVLVGMSGGVDSSVAALQLLRAGYEVVGATFRLWDPEVDSGLGASTCCAVDDVRDAKQVCHTLGIPHYVMNYKQLFQQKVVDYFVAEYQRGATPNPCIACNRHIKFDSFIQKALSMDFDYVATGHYASVLWDEDMGRFRLKRAIHDQKDQSYVLYTFTQHQLAHTLMPLGGYEKEAVRALAQENNLLVSRKPDSQDICFVPDGDYGGFLEAYTGQKAEPGDFIDRDGNKLGRHQGVWRYTIGQRKGLGISFGKPMFVSAIDQAANTVTLADNDALFTRELVADDFRWIDIDQLDAPAVFDAKIRYAADPAPAQVIPLGEGKVRVVFDQPQRAVTKGQAVVFYNGRYVVGGGTILK